MKTGKLWVSSWVILVLTIGLLGGCGITSEPSLTTPAPVVSPVPSATFTQPPVITPFPSATPTQPPTPQPRSEVVLTVLDCLWAFCPPVELEQQVMRAAGRPGILTAETIGEYHVRLVYDPTQLTQEEAAQVFERAAGLEVEVAQ